MSALQQPGCPPTAPPPPFDVLSPGKIVIVGEYAVLDGAPAIVQAIDRGVRCEVRASTGGEDPQVETPDGDDRFVRPALEGAPPAHYRFSAWNPVDLPGKPGFGGSASACVAACVAAGRPPEQALIIHRAVQGGGSGLDVAASIAGGTILFQRGKVVPLSNNLVFSIIFAGNSASTGPRVLQYQRWSGRERFVEASEALVLLFPADPLPVMREAADLLVEMAGRAGLDYLTPGLARIMALAREHGGAAKPSGAGGGDCAVALLPDPESRLAFERACAAEGLPPISAHPAPGARVVAAGASAAGPPTER